MQVCPVCKKRPAVYRGKISAFKESHKFLDYPKLHKYWIQRTGRWDNRKIYPFASCEKCIGDDVRDSFAYHSNGFFRTLNLTSCDRMYDSYELIRITPEIAGVKKPKKEWVELSKSL